MPTTSPDPLRVAPPAVSGQESEGESGALAAVNHLVDALAKATSLEDIYREAISGLVSALRVDRASILLFDPDGVMRFKAWHGLSDAYRAAVEGHSPWSADTVEAAPIVVEDVTQDPGLAALRPTIEGEGIRGLAFVPLLRGRLLGKFMLYSNAPRRFGSTELRLAQTIASLVAFAIERRRDEDRLQLYREIFDRSSDGIGVVDAQGRYVEQNPAHRALLGFEDADLAGRTPALHLGAPTFASISAELAQTGSCRREVVAIRKDGRAIEVDLSAFAILDDAGRPVRYVGLKRDVSERKAAERRLAMQAEALARSNEELQRFAYVSSHDLQEPLRTIASYTQLLERRYRGRVDADGEEFVGYVVEGVRRMQDLIDALLAYARVDRDAPESRPVALDDVLEQAIANLKASVEESGASIEAGPLPEVLGERSQLVQLFQNLLSNAIKFRSEAPPRVRFSAQRDGAFWRIQVQDEGIGIPAQHLDRVFALFHRLHTRDKIAGTGLGLAICKKIVQRHGGRIWVTSREGSGSTFSFTLPARS
jgi:PAS domain S-box-containing protein